MWGEWIPPQTVTTPRAPAVLIMRLQSVLLQVHVVLPQPGSNNAHRVDDKNKNKNIKVELVDKAQIIEDVPFAKEIFQVIILQTYGDFYFLRLLGPCGI